MNNENIYLITESSYEKTVQERVHLYEYIRQLAYIAKQPQCSENYTQLRKAALLYEMMADSLFREWDIPESYMIHENSDDLENIKAAELLDDEDYEDKDTGEDEECVTFFDVMGELIAKSKAVTADMEAVLAELDSELAVFRANANDE